jgi:hypothetical protein
MLWKPWHLTGTKKRRRKMKKPRKTPDQGERGRQGEMIRARGHATETKTVNSRR